MLSENAKKMMRFATKGARALGCLDELIELGPIKVVQETIDDCHDDPTMKANIEDNRAEAERYLAGLWGMA